MYDPWSVAFTIRYPWPAVKNPRTEWEKTYREAFITIWHKDPEKHGDDDSCRQAIYKLSKKERELADSLIDHEYDNLRMWFSRYIPKLKIVGDPDAEENLARFEEICSHDEMKSHIRRIFGIHNRETRWHIPVQWHVWHWRIKIEPVTLFKRWAFSRCCKCGGRFKWHASCITSSWDSTGPLWFRSEKNLWHSNCDPNQPCEQQSAPNA